MQFTINLPAGQRVRQQTAGRMFLLLSPGAASSVQITLYRGTEEIESIRTGQRGFTARMMDADGFSHVDLMSPIDTSAEIIISTQNVNFDFVTGARVTADLANLPIPVSNDRGSPGNLLYVSGVSVNDAPATAVADNPAVTVGSVLVAVLPAAPARREARFINLGTDPVAIGGAGLTWPKRVIVLLPGDLYIETRGANLAWSALTDAGKSASITTQEIVS